jgi:hypothetical protein
VFPRFFIAYCGVVNHGIKSSYAIDLFSDCFRFIDTRQITNDDTRCTFHAPHSLIRAFFISCMQGHIVSLVDKKPRR